MATIAQLLAAAQEVYDETIAGANTHERIGQLFLDIVGFLAGNQFQYDVTDQNPPFISTAGEFITFFQEVRFITDEFTVEVYAAPPHSSGTTAPDLSTFQLIGSGTIVPWPDNLIDYSTDLTEWEAVYGAMSGFLGDWAWFYFLLNLPNGNKIIMPAMRGQIVEEP